MADRPQAPSTEAPKPGISDRIADFVGLAHRPSSEQAVRSDGTLSTQTYGDRRRIAGLSLLTAVTAPLWGPAAGDAAGWAADLIAQPKESTVEQRTEAFTGALNEVIDARLTPEAQDDRDADARMVEILGAETWAGLQQQLAGPLDRATVVQRRGYEENDAETSAVACYLFVPDGQEPQDVDFGSVSAILISVRPLPGDWAMVEGENIVVDASVVSAADNCGAGGITSAFPAALDN